MGLLHTEPHSVLLTKELPGPLFMEEGLAGRRLPFKQGQSRGTVEF